MDWKVWRLSKSIWNDSYESSESERDNKNRSVKVSER